MIPPAGTDRHPLRLESSAGPGPRARVSRPCRSSLRDAEPCREPDGAEGARGSQREPEDPATVAGAGSLESREETPRIPYLAMSARALVLKQASFSNKTFSFVSKRDHDNLGS